MSKKTYLVVDEDNAKEILEQNGITVLSSTNFNLQAIEDICGKERIALTWSMEDVLWTANGGSPDSKGYEEIITEEQAYEILAIVNRSHDCSIGVNWEVIQSHIQMYVEDLNETSK